MTDKEALKLALEALETAARNWPSYSVIDALTAIREALADHIPDTTKMMEQSAQHETMTVQEVWEAAGGNPGIRATKQDVLDALKLLNEVCDEAEQPDMNLNCKSVQARLATSWGYVKAEQPTIKQSLTVQPAQQQEPVRDMPHGWIVNWPHPNGGTKPVYHASAIKPKFGDQLDGKLTMYPVYTHTSPPASKPWVGLTSEERKRAIQFNNAHAAYMQAKQQHHIGREKNA